MIKGERNQTNILIQDNLITLHKQVRLEYFRTTTKIFSKFAQINGTLLWLSAKTAINEALNDLD